jgi:hypothetical protein
LGVKRDPFVWLALVRLGPKAAHPPFLNPSQVLNNSNLTYNLLTNLGFTRGSIICLKTSQWILFKTQCIYLILDFFKSLKLTNDHLLIESLKEKKL